MPCRVSKEDFENIIRAALAELPQRFATALEVVRIEVRDHPTSRMRRQLGLSEQEALLGLYVGRPITQRSVEDSGTLPEVIYLFQAEIEALCENEEEMRYEVRTTVLHELGHHFGLDEENLEDLGYA